jgi:hypothetical protein
MAIEILGLKTCTCPPVFCKRVRKLLMGKGLREHSFLKSAEEIENEGFNFALISAKE